jgi:hypothetical protein
MVEEDEFDRIKDQRRERVKEMIIAIFLRRSHLDYIVHSNQRQ